jgi:LuxR family transcriptional regulator, maltose regulon positive regulatory protein
VNATLQPAPLDTRPPARALAAYRVFALGPLRVEGPGGALRGDWLEQRPGELLRFLVCERHHIVPADVIGEAIWPHAGPAAPNTVRHFVHALRGRLEPGRSPRNGVSAIVCRHGGYGLDHERIWIDADEFERQAAAGLAALGLGRRLRARIHLERALALYVGDFLSDDPYADWALCERERLRAIACDTLRALVEIGPDGAEHETELLERLAALEPFDDDVHRELITAWLRMGRRSRAARHYESFRARLLREFGAAPEFELAQLTARLRPPRCA